MTLAIPAPTRTEQVATPVNSGSLGGQGVRFTAIGSAGTVLQLGLYAATSAFLGAQVASVASWLISTLVTNAAHRAVTFGVRGAARNRSDQIAAFVTCLVGLLITSIVLAELPDATGTSGVIAILAVNTVVGAARFVGMRWWLSPSGRRFGLQLAVAGHAVQDGLHLPGAQHRTRLSGVHH